MLDWGVNRTATRLIEVASSKKPNVNGVAPGRGQGQAGLDATRWKENGMCGCKWKWQAGNLEKTRSDGKLELSFVHLLPHLFTSTTRILEGGAATVGVLGWTPPNREPAPFTALYSC